MDYQLLLLAHLLCFVFWLGSDVCVYYVSGFVVDAKQPVAARLLAARVMLVIDMLPRTCLILMLPFGLTLAAGSGWLPLTTALLTAIWVLSIAWLVLAHAVFRLERRPLGHTLHNIDFVWRLIVLALVIYVAVAGWFGSPIVQNAPWLIAKFGLFAAIIICGLAIRLLLRPFGPLFGKVAIGQADDTTEAALRSTIARVKPVVWIIWTALLAAAFLGLAKPYW
jgi:hypothetical protein